MGSRSRAAYLLTWYTKPPVMRDQKRKGEGKAEVVFRAHKRGDMRDGMMDAHGSGNKIARCLLGTPDPRKTPSPTPHNHLPHRLPLHRVCDEAGDPMIAGDFRKKRTLPFSKTRYPLGGKKTEVHILRRHTALANRAGYPPGTVAWERVKAVLACGILHGTRREIVFVP